MPSCPRTASTSGSPTQQLGRGGKPFYLHPADGSLLALAGIYEFWRDPRRPADDDNAWWTTYVRNNGPSLLAPIADTPAD